MTWNMPNTKYWDDKLIAYFHDPPDKALQIPGHEERSADLLSLFGLQMPNEKDYQAADRIAAGFDRGVFPSFSKNSHESGAVNFTESPVLTHPFSANHLKLTLPEAVKNKAGRAQLHQDVLRIINRKIGEDPKASDAYSNSFRGDNATFARARVLFAHLVLRHVLAREEKTLGPLWHHLPADTRMPDHSIWHHNGLTSAINSCMQYGEVGLMVYSIGPVQKFINKARKLRDYWTGSVILSWIAFEGIRWVMEHLGPDHIIYPSLADQPLVWWYLQQEWRLEDRHCPPPEWPDKGVASLPNKFLALVPFKHAEAIAAGIQAHIVKAWEEFNTSTFDWILRQMELTAKSEPEAYAHLHALLDRQVSRFWTHEWSATPLLDWTNENDVKPYIPASSIEPSFKASQAFDKIKFQNSTGASKGTFYEVTHQLAQTALAGTKLSRSTDRQPEPGEKCHLSGEFEVLHMRPHQEGEPVQVYKESCKAFWNRARKHWNQRSKDEADPSGSEFGDNEMLCGPWLVRRLAPIRAARDPEWQSVLSAALAPGQSSANGQRQCPQGIIGFPSTTSLALNAYFNRTKATPGERNQVAYKAHDDDSRMPGRTHDRYYAILAMDGDHMGKLVGGENIKAYWRDVIHPRLIERGRLEGDGDDPYRIAWSSPIDWSSPVKKSSLLNSRRLLSPATHVGISEALADFSLFCVPAIIKKYDGVLIYSGGDDVMAAVPREHVLRAAREIQEAYRHGFRHILPDGTFMPLGAETDASRARISMGMGRLTISAAALICHHKQPMTAMIAKSHALLDSEAKRRCGRDGCVVALDKRGGEERMFAAKWGGETWRAFQSLVKDLSAANDTLALSSSLVYRLKQFEDGLTQCSPEERTELITYLVKHSGLERGSLARKPEDLAKDLAQVIVKNKARNEDMAQVKDKDKALNFHAPIVAAFCGKGAE